MDKCMNYDDGEMIDAQDWLRNDYEDQSRLISGVTKID